MHKSVREVVASHGHFRVATVADQRQNRTCEFSNAHLRIESLLQAKRRLLLPELQ